MAKNPFKFGTVVEDEYFTDRVRELSQIEHLLESENHLVLISPRRFGKTSLVTKAVRRSGRPCVWVNLQSVVSTTHFAATLLQELFKLHRWEQLKYELSHFRIVPTITANSLSESVEVSFQTVPGNAAVMEDAFALLEKVSKPEQPLIVVLDEFQEISTLEKGLDKRLRAIMQAQRGINYIILGSQESMMTEIFERKKSPFYHFGQLMHLRKIPAEDFRTYVSERLTGFAGHDGAALADQILAVTACHPYYTQQLAAQVWNLLAYEQVEEGDVVAMAVEQLTEIHDLDFERLWLGFNNTDKRILQTLCQRKALSHIRALPTSTLYSAVKRLMQAGYIVKEHSYEVEDPFFRRWIIRKRL